MRARPASLDRNQIPVEGDLRLPTPPGVIRQFWYRHPRLTDSLVAGAYLLPALGLAAVIGIAGNGQVNGSLVPYGLALLTFGALAMLFRRSRPWTVLIVCWVITLLAAPVFGTVDAALVPLALYALAVYGSVRSAWIGFAASFVVGFAASFLAGTLTSTPVSGGVVGSAGQFNVFLLIVVLVGINIGNRRRYVVALLDRAAQLARERDQQAQLAAAAERSRIAREMHDIVSHGLTVMVTLAEGSAATAPASPERAAEAMRQVAETGRQALTDMRRMLGLLDDGTPSQSAVGELAPQPGVAEIAPLIDGFRSAGLAVRLTTEGSPPADPAEQLTIYRLVQESLTNVLRHSGPVTSVDVALLHTPSGVTITVTNDGPVAETVSSGGRGAIGMRERVALYGGTVDSGPRPGGGWSVVATLAHESPPQPLAAPVDRPEEIAP